MLFVTSMRPLILISLLVNKKNTLLGGISTYCLFNKIHIIDLLSLFALVTRKFGGKFKAQSWFLSILSIFEHYCWSNLYVSILWLWFSSYISIEFTVHVYEYIYSYMISLIIRQNLPCFVEILIILNMNYLDCQYVSCYCEFLLSSVHSCSFMH